MTSATASAHAQIVPKEKVKTTGPLGTKSAKEEEEQDPFVEDTDIILGGVSMKAKQFHGIGTLNVETGRGEVKARSGDFILTYSDPNETLRMIMSEAVFATIWKNLGGTEIPTQPEALEKKVLNSKSGPDKFTLPRDPEPPLDPEVDNSLPKPAHPAHLPAAPSDRLDRPKAR
jgi:hypothetical protein